MAISPLSRGPTGQISHLCSKLVKIVVRKNDISSKIYLGNFHVKVVLKVNVDMVLERRKFGWICEWWP